MPLPFMRMYPVAKFPNKVGSYPAEVASGGGYFYDDILEYRVWEKINGDLRLHSFTDYKDALAFSKKNPNAEKPLVLILQNKYIDEPKPGLYKLVKKVRLAEWQVKWLKGNEYTQDRVLKFLKRYNHGLPS